MTVRSLCGYANAYYMNWVSNKVLTDIRAQLFSKMIRQSMDFFNKMQSGFLMSQITNNTRLMQTALSSISSDLFKQPVAIISGIAVLLYMDWKFTIVTLVLFPSCLVPLSMYGKRARKAVNNEQEGMAEMVVTMQESFAGIRVIKSFAREEQQEKDFRRSNQSQFSNSMRILRSMEAVSPLVEDNRRNGCGSCPPLCLFREPAGGEIYRPHRRHLSPLRANQNPEPDAHHDAAFHRVDDNIFEVLDTESTVLDAPDAVALKDPGASLTSSA